MSNDHAELERLARAAVEDWDAPEFDSGATGPEGSSAAISAMRRAAFRAAANPAAVLALLAELRASEERCEGLVTLATRRGATEGQISRVMQDRIEVRRIQDEIGSLEARDEIDELRARLAQAEATVPTEEGRRALLRGLGGRLVVEYLERVAKGVGDV